MSCVIIFYTDITCSHITDIIVSTVLIKTVTRVTISQSCTLKSTCIQTPPVMSSDIFTSGGPWVAGGIIVGVVNGVHIMVIIWGLITVIRKRRRNANMKKNDER